MISEALVAKIRYLLETEKLSQRKVAALTGVSRSTVQAIASGKWAARRRRAGQAESEGSQQTTRCPQCGARIVGVTCRACQVKRLIAEGKLRPLEVSAEGPPRLELEGPCYARYLEVRAAALARGEPLADGDGDANPPSPNWAEVQEDLIDEILCDMALTRRPRDQCSELAQREGPLSGEPMGRWVQGILFSEREILRRAA